MDCPRCRSPRLKPTKLADGLPAEGCRECRGALVALLTYRDWLERHPLEESFGKKPTYDILSSEKDDAKAALACPKCGGIMTKYRISAETPRRLDLCVRCNEVWLDDGEWELIRSLALSEPFSRIFNDGWQLRIKKADRSALSENRFRGVFGKDYDEIGRIRSWLEGHPQRREILDYLNREDER